MNTLFHYVCVVQRIEREKLMFRCWRQRQAEDSSTQSYRHVNLNFFSSRDEELEMLSVNKTKYHRQIYKKKNNCVEILSY